MDMANPELPSREVLDPRNYSTRSPAVKRLLREAMEFAEPDSEIYAQPLEDNLFEWHFTIRGAPETDFERGIYHGRIILPAEYPMKPPSIILMTPNGRFETGVKICLSISSYHPETWQPSWSLRTALVALISFMATDSPGAIGSLEVSSEARRNLARKSLTWVCPTCGPAINLIKCVAFDKDAVNQASSPSAPSTPQPQPWNEEDSPVVTDSNLSTPLQPERPEHVEETPDMNEPIDLAVQFAGPIAEVIELNRMNLRQMDTPLTRQNLQWIQGRENLQLIQRRENRMGNALYGFALGAVILGISLILLRRLLIFIGWGDVFEYFG